MADSDHNFSPASRAGDDWKSWLAWAWAWPFLAAFATAFWIMESRALVTGYGEPDPSGYFLMAREFAHGRPGTFPADDLLRFADHFWVKTPAGEIACKFAPGYPLLLAFTRALFGEEAMFQLNPALGCLALIGAFMLFRHWMRPLAALLATTAWGASLLFSFYVSVPLTHAADMCCVTWAMYFLWRWLDSAPGRGTLPALAAGLLLGFSLWIRPTNALLLLPAGVAMLAQFWNGWRHETRPWGSMAAFVASLCVFPALLLVYQWRVFGSPLTTGYALSGDAGSFSREFFADRAPRYLAILRDVVGLPFLVGAVGLLLGGRPRDRLLRFAWAVPLVVLHCFYYWDQPVFTWNLRFLLSGLVVFYGAAFALIDSDRSSLFRGVVLLAFFAACVFTDRSINRTQDERVSGAQVLSVLWDPAAAQKRADNREAVSVVVAALPTKAFVFADSPYCHYLTPRKSLTVYQLQTFNLNHGQRRWVNPARHPDWDPRQQPERREALGAFYREKTQADLSRLKREKISALLQAGNPVFLVLGPKRLEQEKRELGPGLELSRIDAPLAGEAEVYLVRADPAAAASQPAANTAPAPPPATRP